MEYVAMVEKIKEILIECRFTYATMRILLQSCIAKDSEPYIAKCIGVYCRECPFYGFKSLCDARLSNEDWKDIAKQVLNYEY